jgi:predicted DNA-binding transcriptional regulator YafY
MTAAALASELEVSVRTIYRDIDALSGAGVPVIGDSGPGGGYALLPHYRSGLTALTPEELQALALLRVPLAAAGIGADDALRRALRKLLAAGGAPTREAGESTRQRILIEPMADAPTTTPPALLALHRAVMASAEIEVSFALPVAATPPQTISPLGLVFDAERWHLVFRRSGPSRTRTVDSVVSVRETGRHFVRDPRFRLEEYWQGVAAQRSRRSEAYGFHARVAPGALGALLRLFQGRATTVEGGTLTPPPMRLGQATVFPPPERWIDVKVRTDSLDSARTGVLALGGAIEVSEPDALRESVRDYARTVASVYESAAD